MYECGCELKPVWISRYQATQLGAFATVAYDACPTDPVEMVAEALGAQADWPWEKYSDAYHTYWRLRAEGLMIKLGMPK